MKEDIKALFEGISKRLKKCSRAQCYLQASQEALEALESLLDQIENGTANEETAREIRHLRGLIKDTEARFNSIKL